MGKTKYIDADKVIDYANQEVSSPFFSIEREGAEDVVTYKNKWAFVKQVMIGMPAADIEPKWIPCSERLPEEDYETGTGVQFSADVLATIVNHANDGELYVWLLKTVDGKWYDYIPNEDGTHEIPYWCEVIAWMPLPTPYKGGGEE